MSDYLWCAGCDTYTLKAMGPNCRKCGGTPYIVACSAEHTQSELFHL